MNRIQKYQDSIERFFKNKSYLTYLNNEEADIIINLIKKNNYFITIFLLTIINNINKKNKIHQHGYYIGSSMELALLLIRGNEKENEFDLEKNLLIKILNLMNILLSKNLEVASAILSKEKLIKNYSSAFKDINTKIINILEENKIESNNNFNTTDLLNYKFLNNVHIIRVELKNSNKLLENEIIKYIENKYCKLFETAFILTWNLGGGQEQLSKYFERLGHYYAFLVKIYYDIIELETDIINKNKINNFYPNIVINLGIQRTFECFVTYKKKFIELSFKLGIYSGTLNELIEYIESRIEVFLNNTIPDLREDNEIEI
jgi:hypothetical protein